MKFVLVGPPEECDIVREKLLAFEQEAAFSRCSYEEVRLAPTEGDLAFLMVDSMDAVYAARVLAEQTPAVPLVFISHSPDYAMEAIRLGVIHYLIWPLEEVDHQTIMQRLLERKGGDDGDLIV